VTDWHAVQARLQAAMGELAERVLTRGPDVHADVAGLVWGDGLLHAYAEFRIGARDVITDGTVTADALVVDRGDRRVMYADVLTGDATVLAKLDERDQPLDLDDPAAADTFAADVIAFLDAHADTIISTLWELAKDPGRAWPRPDEPAPGDQEAAD
jgi:hypothetical protein